MLLVTCGLAQPGCVVAGGQTGQPTSADCPPGTPEAIQDTDTWHDAPAGPAAQAFEGEYSAGLSWFAGNAGDPSSPVAFDDTLTLRVRRAASSLRVAHCKTQLLVPVSLVLSTSHSGIATTVEGELEVSSDGPHRASLHIDTDALKLDTELVDATAGSSVSGSLVPKGTGAPGGWASF